MINLVCDRCRKGTNHQIKETKLEGYQDYKILICQNCGEKTMVPKEALKNINKVEIQEETEEVNVGTDGGFDREAEASCEGGICPSR